MRKKFENTFSWSKSRDELFRECPRKYYYDKYGFWEGWRTDAPPDTRELYLLKQVRSRRMWMGSAVHQAVERALKGMQGGQKVSQDEIIYQMTEQMRADYRLSRAGRYVHDPKRICALFEHVYDIPVEDAQWKELSDTAIRCVKSFFDSDLLKRALDANTESWLPIEDLQSFMFEEVKIFVKLDFAFREGKRVIVVDWKTGLGEDVDVTVQLGCYAIYARQRWGLDPEDIEAIEFNLNTLKEQRVTMIEARLEWAQHYIRNSIASMKKVLRDPDRNRADPDDFERTTDQKKCRWCNYRRVCLPDKVF